MERERCALDFKLRLTNWGWVACYCPTLIAICPHRFAILVAVCDGWFILTWFRVGRSRETTLVVNDLGL